MEMITWKKQRKNITVRRLDSIDIGYVSRKD
jgi:hypothetical protein